MFTFKVRDGYFLEATGDGVFLAKKGSMVADMGEFKYEKSLSDGGQGSVGQKLAGMFVRSLTNESMEVMKVSGKGTVYLADQARHVEVLDLAQFGQAGVTVEADNLLAYTLDCQLDVVRGSLTSAADKGLFSTKLTPKGSEAKVAIVTAGRAIWLPTPCKVDPDALIAWTGEKGTVELNNINWKTFVGQASGESYSLHFKTPGYRILVQASEV